GLLRLIVSRVCLACCPLQTRSPATHHAQKADVLPPGSLVARVERSETRDRCCGLHRRPRISLRSIWATSLSPQAEQARRVAAENGDLVVVAERRGGEDAIHRMLLPWDRMVAADDDLAGADLGDQMAERLGREHQRIEIDLIEIFARLLLQLDLGLQFSGDTKQAWSPRAAYDGR